MADFKLYLIKRVGYIVLSLFIISALIFSFTQLLPGNAAVMILGQYATEEKVADLEAELGLTEPVHEQYLDWIGGVLTGDWGQSYHYGNPVVEVLGPRLSHSLQLAGLSLLLVVLLGIPLGVLAAVKRGSAPDYVISGTTYVGVSMPEFVIGTLLLLLFAGPVWSIFPSGGFVPLSEGVVPWLMHLALPSLTLMILLLAHIVRQTRSGVIESLQAEYTRTARLKGVPELGVLAKHALRNGLLPTITVLAIDVGWLMGSIVVVEEVFAFPGVGRLVVRAIQNRDLPLIQITILLIAASYAVANLIADIAYTYLDPRIDYGE